MKKLSIIVPVYNVEKYLDQCVHSITQQDFTEFDLILVDDGSTDSSGAKCDEWEERDPRIRVFHKPNGGLMSAWKYGVLHSESEYVGFVDSDDWIDANMYTVLIGAAEKHQSDLVACAMIQEFEDGKSQKQARFLQNKTYSKDEIYNKIFPILISGGDYVSRGLPPNRMTKLFKREILERNLQSCDERVSIGEDLLTTFAVLPSAQKITVIPDFYPYHYRINGESMIHKYSDTKYEKLCILRKCMLALNKHQSFDFTKQINTDFIKLMLMQLDNEILYSGKKAAALKKSMKSLFHASTFQQALSASETEKMPIKYRIYLKCARYRFYTAALLMRKIKKV